MKHLTKLALGLAFYEACVFIAGHYMFGVVAQ
jgi:hypothetical protein